MKENVKGVLPIYIYLTVGRCYLVFSDMVNGAGEYGFSSDWCCYITNGSCKFWYLQHVVFYEVTLRY